MINILVESGRRQSERLKSKERKQWVWIRNPLSEVLKSRKQSKRTWDPTTLFDVEVSFLF